MSVVINAAFASCLSFLVFWLVFHESIKSHDVGGHTVYFAPAYLFMIILGMIGLVTAPRLKFEDKDEVENNDYDSEQKLMDGLAGEEDDDDDDENRPPKRDSPAWKLLGLCGALCAGFFSACQYGVVTIGRHYAEHQHQVLVNSSGHSVMKNCDTKKTDDYACPAVTKEQFNNFGSWMTSFGIGAFLSTSFYYMLFAIYYSSNGLPIPNPARTWNVMKGPGTLAGLCWCLGNFFNTAAVVSGGNAIIMPISMCTTLITSGAWGIVYYGEVSGKNATAWVCAAVWTLAFMVALGFEKG